METVADFCILRDMGINKAQGFLIGRAAQHPDDLIPNLASELISGSGSLFPRPTLAKN